MSGQPLEPRSMPHARVADFGEPARWKDHGFTHPVLGEIRGKVFLREVLGLTGMEVSLGSLPPGGSMPFLHDHRQNEELYLFLSGTGEFQVDGEVFPVGPGSAVRVAPGGMRAWRAVGEASLEYLVVQAKAGCLETASLQDGFKSPDEVRWTSLKP